MLDHRCHFDNTHSKNFLVKIHRASTFIFSLLSHLIFLSFARPAVDDYKSQENNHNWNT